MAYYLIFQGDEEAENNEDWDNSEGSVSETEEEMEYEEENINNLHNRPSPGHAVAAVWAFYILFIYVALAW